MGLLFRFVPVVRPIFELTLRVTTGQSGASSESNGGCVSILSFTFGG